MEKRFDEQNQRNLIKLVEDLTGKKASAQAIKQVIHGADEIDLVNSGLEDTMITSYQDIRKFKKAHKGIKDLRTAAFGLSISKIRDSYYSMGIFP